MIRFARTGIRMVSLRRMQPRTTARSTSVTSHRWGIVTLLSKKVSEFQRIRGQRRRPVRVAGAGAYNVAIQIPTEQSKNGVSIMGALSSKIS